MRIRYALTFLLLLAACAPAEPSAPTETSLPTASPTATIDWFPATATHTPTATAEPSPTPNLHPGVGALLLSEDFADDEYWDTSQSDNSSALVANGRLTLRTQLANGLVLSARNEVAYRDFYAEITASPSICDGEDEYGLVVRNNSSGNHYRFALSCDGRAKVDRFHNGSLVIHESWVTSLVVPAVAPSVSRIAVWASGSQLRFFVNDTLIFTTSDPILFVGRLGVFIRQDGSGTQSVSFSDLQVWALEE